MRPQPRYQPGDKIGGRYQVHQALMGGMGEVYLCLDLEQMYPFALKTFQQRYLTQAQRLRATFEQEVATWVALEKHPNIVRCFSMDILDRQPFMLLEWVAGEEGRGTDLRSWLGHGPFDLRLALDFTVDICRGLIHAQEKQPGIVHRDLKPENILVAQGGLAKITDFGLAQIVQEAELEITPGAEGKTDGRQSLLGHSGIVGTPSYMAPEQWRGEAPDARTDIYAVGCILYELLAGSRAFRAATLDGLRRQHLEMDIPKLTGNQSLPDPLDTLLARCLAKRREERFTTMDDLLQQLSVIYRREFAESPKVTPIGDEFTASDYNNRGIAYHNLKRYQEALTDLNRAIQVDPNFANAYASRGNTYVDLQRYDKALADFQRAIQLDPTLIPAYAQRSSTYAALGRYAEALADVNRVIQLDPRVAQSYWHRGNIHAAMQRYDKALADYNRAIQLNSNDANAYQCLGITYYELRQYDKALTAYNRAIHLDPGFVNAYINRGVIYDDLQQYSEALADYNRAIQLDPTDATTYFNRGNTYQSLQRYDEALEDYKQAIQLDPNYGRAYFCVGDMLLKQGKLREALPYFERVAGLGYSDGIHRVAQVRQLLRIASSLKTDPAEIQVALEAISRSNSLKDVQRAATQMPFMTESSFIRFVEQDIAETPPKHRPAFDQRLAWLRQIANKQKREE